VVRGFHTAMAKVPREDADPRLAAFDILHGERLVLVDRMGRIRGYYNADDRDRLLRHARSLDGRGPRMTPLCTSPVWAYVWVTGVSWTRYPLPV